MEPSDQRFKGLTDYELSAPRELRERVLLYYDSNFAKGISSDKEISSLLLINQQEVLPPVLLTDKIFRQYRFLALMKKTRRFLQKALVVLVLPIIAICYFYFSDSNAGAVEEVQVVESMDQPLEIPLVTDSVMLVDSVASATVLPIRKQSYSKLKINGVDFFLDEESDLLLSYIKYQIVQDEQQKEVTEDIISLDEFSTIRINAFTAKLIRQAVQQNRQGDLKRRARKVLRRLEALQLKEAERFGDFRIASPLNPFDLVDFIDGKKNQ